MIKVIEKALNILELLAGEQDREISLGEIASTLNMDRGTCSNIIKTLAARGYVQQDSPRRGYRFGYTPFKLTNSYINNELMPIGVLTDIGNILLHLFYLLNLSKVV